MATESLRHNDSEFKRASVRLCTDTHTHTHTKKEEQSTHCQFDKVMTCAAPKVGHVFTPAWASSPQTTDAVDDDVWFLWLSFNEPPGIIQQCHSSLPEIRSFKMSHYANPLPSEQLFNSFCSFIFPRKLQQRCADRNLDNMTMQNRRSLSKASVQECYKELFSRSHVVTIAVETNYFVHAQLNGKCNL